MDRYEILLDNYKKLQYEFSNYQNFAEKTIQDLNFKVNDVGKKLDSLTNIVEVSKYINSYISDDNLIPMINDMIIGILGVTYSSIYIKEKDELTVKAANFDLTDNEVLKRSYFSDFENGKPFIKNNTQNLFVEDLRKEEIHSMIGVPITLREKFIGYIVVEHTLFDFFNNDHIKFISSIANQIGIALENNSLYNKIKEASTKDPLLNVYNRRYFFSYVENLVSLQNNEKFAIVMMDFDNFKKINDIYGHQFGDEVLMQTVKLVESLISSKDVLARYGGEEIVIFIDSAERYEEIYNRIDNIRKQISENEIKFGDIDKIITASFGLSFYPNDGNTLQKVISAADKMMYEAKRQGKNKLLSTQNFN